MFSRRFTELDGLRGVAALMVVLYHYIVRYNEIYGASEVTILSFYWLLYGVHLFFAISGFAIYYTILKRGVGTEFIVARVARLYPGYLFALLLTYLVVSAFGLQGREKEVIDLFKNLIIFHSFFGMESIDGVYWTLSYEVVFYTLIFMIANVGTKTSLYRKFAIIYLACDLVILFCGENSVAGKIVAKLFIHEYMPFFLIGMFFCEGIRSKSSVDFLGMVLISILLYLSHAEWLAFIIVFLIFMVTVKGWANILNYRVARYLGGISYSLYLVHQNIGYIVINRWIESIGIYCSIIVALVVSICIASFSYYFVERVGKEWVLKKYERWSDSIIERQ